MTENIFLSYRRDDSRGYTNAIYTILEFHFGSDQIFMDIDTLVPGSDFVKCLEDAVEGCDIFLAIIGLRWENIKDKEGNRRLENPEDFVRIEVAHALKRGIPVIPVLVDDAEMPSSENLPDNLKELTRRHAFSIGNYMRTDVQHLIKVLEKTFESLEQERIKLEKAEENRKAREQTEEDKKTAQEKAKAERLEKERAEAEHLEKIKAETERLEKIKAENERLKKERAEAERLAKERAETERLEKEKAETERLKKEKAEVERLEKIKAETERLEKIKAETERLKKERADQDGEVPEIVSKSKRNIPGIVLGIIGAGAVLVAGWYFLGPNLFGPEATEIPATQELLVVEATLEPTPIPTAVPVAWRRLNSLQFIPRDLVTVILEDPTDQDVWYAGTSNAGIYKTINGGDSWAPFMQGLSSARVATLVIDPADPNTLYAGLIYEGVSKTTDGGNTWFAVNNGIQDKNTSVLGFEQDVSEVVISALDTQHLYFTEGHYIYETRDGGGSWTKNHSFNNDKINQIVIHPENDDILFMVTVENPVNAKVWKSEDSGNSWVELFEDNNNEYGRTDFWVDDVDGDLMYYISNGQRVHISQDGGLTWNSAASLESEMGITMGTSWVGEAAFVQTGDKLYQTADSGSTWTRAGYDRIPFPQFSDLEVSAQDDPLVYLGTSGVYVNRLDNQGWIDRSVGLGGVRVALYLDPSNNNSFYMTVSGDEQVEQGDLFASEDGGINWELRSGSGEGESRASFNVAGGDVIYQLRNGILVSSADKGKTWSEFGGTQEAYSLLVNPYQPDIFVVGRYSDLPVVSDDHGATWEEISGEIGHVFKMAFVKNEPDLMYVLAPQLARSVDGGLIWRSCGGFDVPKRRNPIMSLSEPMGIVDPRDSFHLFAATWDGIITTYDGCQTWQFSNNGLNSLKTNSISADPNNPDTIYAGTDNGAYVSFDSGDLWQPINEGLLDGLVIYSIVVDTDSNVYAATPLGLFQLEDQ